MTNSTGKIQFIQNHKPALDAGTYEIKVSQTVEGKDINVGNSFASSLTFVVQGNRFDLNPQDIHAVFPPAGSSGDHSNVLPHIVLKRSTLPWERNVQIDKDVPWLALILIHEGEMAQSEDIKEDKNAQSEGFRIVTLKKLWSGVTLETGQNENDKVAVIDVPQPLLSEILPSIDDLQYLAHVRQVTDQITPDNEPLAVVISNRLPKKGGNSTAYLISLENRYDLYNDNGLPKKTDTKDHIRLVVLKSWSFSCTRPEQDFKGLLTNLNRNTLLRLPPNTNSEAEEYLAKGYVPLPHYLRQGGKTFSWYHSPLLPAENPKSIALSQLSVRCADQLLSYNATNGLFDTSYAAAWQLGQLLALQDKSFAINLFNCKRSNAQKLAKESQLALYPHLFTSQPNTGDDIEFPNDINTWFEQLRLLKGVPFHYLVPDDRMLLPESICFFWLDWFWVESLLDGAFSIGRVQASDAKQDSQNKPLLGTKKKLLAS